MPYCIAQYCHVSDKNYVERGAHFHSLPSKRNSALRRQWLAKCKRSEPRDNLAKVCSEHFCPDDYSNLVQFRAGFANHLLLKGDAVPSIFAEPETPPSLPLSAKPPSASDKRRRERQASRNKKQLLNTLFTPGAGRNSYDNEHGESTAYVESSSQLDQTINFESSNQLEEVINSSPAYTLTLTEQPIQATESHCKCCRYADQTPKIDKYVQTDMDQILAVITEDHTYAAKRQPTRKASIVDRVDANLNGRDASSTQETEIETQTSSVMEIESESSDDDEDPPDDVDDADFLPPDVSSESDSDIDSNMDSDIDEIASDTRSDFKDINTYSVPDNIADDRKFLVFECSLMDLFRKCQKPGCSAIVREVKNILSGSRLIVTTKCEAGCTYNWSSQPTLEKMGAGNLLLSAAVLFSGSTYAQLADMSNYLKMPILGKSQFYVLQRRYLFPVVNESWITCQTMVLDGLSQESDIVLSGDGRCDSPGHCAKYCTYSILNTKTGLIVDFVVKNKADPMVKNSNSMEPMGLKECLNNLQKWDIAVSILATDRHPVIRKIMRVEYPNITHQFDLWHFCKSIVKKISATCGHKNSLAPLLDWMPSISNHFWWSAESCNGSVDVLQEKWESVINHTANIHSWRDKKHFHQCGHSPLSDDDRRHKSWLGVGSQAHDALVKIVKNKLVQKDLKYCTLFCHTGDLEVYHSLMLKYAPKRQHFSYEGMVCRTQLAAIDHNYGSGRPQATTKQDQPRFNVVQPKTFTNTSKWVAKQVKVAKDYSYREDMVRDVVLMRTHKLKKSHAVLPEVKRNIAHGEKPEKAAAIQATFQNTRFRKGAN